MKYKVTSLIVCAFTVFAVIFFSLSCEKSPVAPDVASEDMTLDATKTRFAGELIIDLPCCNDQVSSIAVYGDTAYESYVLLYKEPNYEGKPELFIAEDPNLDGWKWTNGNITGSDRASSVKLVRGATCILYRDSRFGGFSYHLTESCPDLFYIGLDDAVSAIKVYGVSAKGVVLYEHYEGREYGYHPGKSETFIHHDSKLGDNYIGNDCVSMIKLVNIEKYEVTLYKNYNYSVPLECWK